MNQAYHMNDKKHEPIQWIFLVLLYRINET